VQGETMSMTAAKAAAQVLPGEQLVERLIVLIGAHSCILGLLMLFVPRYMMRLMGLDPSIPLFFPSQSGVFLLIIGICYLLALRQPAFEVIIPISKSFAVIFLTVHCLFLGAPSIIWAACFVDALMLAAFSAALSRRRRLACRG
jgi:hypothetical protein